MFVKKLERPSQLRLLLLFRAQKLFVKFKRYARSYCFNVIFIYSFVLCNGDRRITETTPNHNYIFRSSTVDGENPGVILT